MKTKKNRIAKGFASGFYFFTPFLKGFSQIGRYRYFFRLQIVQFFDKFLNFSTLKAQKRGVAPSYQLPIVFAKRFLLIDFNPEVCSTLLTVTAGFRALPSQFHCRFAGKAPESRSLPAPFSPASRSCTFSKSFVPLSKKLTHATISSLILSTRQSGK